MHILACGGQINISVNYEINTAEYAPLSPCCLSATILDWSIDLPSASSTGLSLQNFFLQDNQKRNAIDILISY